MIKTVEVIWLGVEMKLLKRLFLYFILSLPVLSCTQNKNSQMLKVPFVQAISPENKEQDFYFYIKGGKDDLYTANIEINFSDLPSEKRNVLTEDWEKQKSLKFSVFLWYIDNEKGSVPIPVYLSTGYQSESKNEKDIYIPEVVAYHNGVVNGQKVWLHQYRITKFHQLNKEGYYHIKIIPLIKQDDVAKINMNLINLYLSVEEYTYPK